MIYSTAKIVISGIEYTSRPLLEDAYGTPPPGIRPLSDFGRVVIGHDQFTIGDWVLIVQKKLSIGARSQANAGAKLVGNSELIIGEDVVVSYNAVIITGTDAPEGNFMNDAQPESERAMVRGKVILEDGCFIGAGAVVCVSKKHPEIRIGKRAVVGASSYIDKDVAADTVIHPAYSWSRTRR